MENIIQTLDKAIKTRDIRKVRDILTTSIVQDPGFDKGVFDERLKRCLEGGLYEEDIFVPFEGKELINDIKIWTDDYYAAQATELRYNFSKERLEHCRKVGKHTSSNEEAKKKSANDNEGLPAWLLPAIGVGAAVLILFWLLSQRN